MTAWRGSVSSVEAGQRTRAWRLTVAAAVGLISISLHPARGDTDTAPSGWQVWAGADISADVWLVYTGVTVAPWSGMHDDGFRFRAATGYGGYQYKKEADPNPESSDERLLSFKAQTYFADFLVGYLKRFGELTAKAFVGASMISHDIAPSDDYTVAYGDETGVKGALELWLNMGERGWGSLDLSWSSAHDTRAARMRTGYRVWPKISLGVEAALNVDAQGACRMKKAGAKRCGKADVDEENGVPYHYESTELLDYFRSGAFVRYEWDGGELSLSVGALNDTRSQSAADIEPYVTFNWLTQF